MSALPNALLYSLSALAVYAGVIRLAMVLMPELFTRAKVDGAGALSAAIVLGAALIIAATLH